MEISEVKIRRIYHQEERLCAMASIVIDNAVAVHEVKIINGPNRKFIAMPSRKEKTALTATLCTRSIGLRARRLSVPYSQLMRRPCRRNSFSLHNRISRQSLRNR